jgi:hypothetical protein
MTLHSPTATTVIGYQRLGRIALTTGYDESEVCLDHAEIIHAKRGLRKFYA